MELTSQYKISDILRRNIHNSFDILIYKPDFLCSNIENVQFFLSDDNGNKTTKLDGLTYEIIFSISPIYKNILKSGTNLFTNSYIPFGYNIFHEGFFVLESLDNKMISEIINYTITFIYKVSTILLTYPPNQITGNNYEMNWNTGIDETNQDNNKFRFIDGMCGVAFNSNRQSSYFNDDYFLTNKSTFISGENFELNNSYGLKISHLDEQNNWVQGYKSECNPYHCNKILQSLIEHHKPAKELPPYQIIHETFKLPIGFENFSIQQYNMDSTHSEQTEITNLYICKFTLCYGNHDALTNIQFICPNTKYHFKNVKLILCSKAPVEYTVNNKPIYGNKFESFELEFEETNYGYKILGLDNFLVIPTLSCTMVNISIELNMCDYFILSTNLNVLVQKIPDLWIKFDRIIYNSDIRQNLQINKIDFEEFPIVDIIDYFKEKDVIIDQLYIPARQNNICIPNFQKNMYMLDNPDLLYREKQVQVEVEEQIQIEKIIQVEERVRVEERVQVEEPELVKEQLQPNTPINLPSYADFVSKYYTPLFYAELLIMALVIPIIIYENYA